MNHIVETARNFQAGLTCGVIFLYLPQVAKFILRHRTIAEVYISVITVLVLVLFLEIVKLKRK